MYGTYIAKEVLSIHMHAYTQNDNNKNSLACIVAGNKNV